MADNPPVPRKATWRMGARQRERLQWAVVAIICVLLFFALRPYYYHIVEVREFQTCQSNMLQISRGIALYSEDNDNALPLGRSWTDTVQGYLAARSGTGFHVEDIFHCPKDSTGGKSSYAMNSVLDGYSSVFRSKKEAELKARMAALRPDRLPLIVEKHGSAFNAFTRISDWDALARVLSRPHDLPQPTGSVIWGSLKPSSVTTERLEIRAGQNF